jgi:hypothetical protein
MKVNITLLTTITSMGRRSRAATPAPLAPEPEGTGEEEDI